jgi:imidazolonepropionase-like amidohydrolase
VEAGMAPMEAIVSATGDGAEAIGLGEKTGTVVAGKWADVVAVEDNPLDGIAVLKDVAFVMKAGEVVKNKVRNACG